MRRSNYRHPGSERGLGRVCPPIRYVSSGARGRAKARNSRIVHFVSQLGVGNSSTWRPNLVLLYTEKSRREPKTNLDLRCTSVAPDPYAILGDYFPTWQSGGQFFTTIAPGSIRYFREEFRFWAPKPVPVLYHYCAWIHTKKTKNH